MLYPPASALPVHVVANVQLTPGDSAVHHVVLGWQPGHSMPVRPGLSVGIPPAGLNARGRPHPPRLFSVASPTVGEPGHGSDTLALTVKRFWATDPDTGVRTPGLASHVLCDAQPGAELRMTGPVGGEMELPADPSAPLLLIATGTGIAPCRAYVLERFGPGAAPVGPVWLIQGAANREELLYAELWEATARAEPSLFAHLAALSRVERNPAGGRMHVDDRLREHGDRVWQWLTRADAHVFVCGVKGTERAVAAALTDIGRAVGEDGEALRQRLRAEGRWRVETY
ncbi:MAG: hypothetical protein EXR79_00845 [Myxococcales bacterium]|nr:hypothetical protein [Myxococcales bacterium]